LDVKAFGRSGFKLNRQQVIGKVSVTSAHTALSEQTNREGLVESGAAHALRTIVTWLLDNEMRALINDADKDEKLSKREAERVAVEFRETQRQVEQTLDAIRKRASPDQRVLVDRLSTQIALLSDQCENVVGKTDAMTEELQDEREKFVHLAGIGLMTEFIFHELDRAVGHTVRTLAEAQESGGRASLRALEAQLVTLQKRIATFDDLAGERRQTKSNFDLVDLVDLVLENHANQFERHGIKIDFDRPKGGFKIRAVRGMVIQILENLISNSVYWLKQEKTYLSLS
jgi:signal transduction histidine kinase